MLSYLVVVLAYLLGSIPVGYLVVRFAEGGDVRETGSGGTGATNVTRRAGRKAGVVTLLLDALKGAAAVLLARSVLTEDFGINWWVAASGLAAIAGHVFPVWLRFRGGKGVATGLGVFLVLSPISVLLSVPIFLLMVRITRYVSLGSIAATAALPLWVWLLNARGSGGVTPAPLLTTAAAGAALIIFMHRANVVRLLSGTENKLK